MEECHVQVDEDEDGTDDDEAEKENADTEDEEPEPIVPSYTEAKKRMDTLHLYLGHVLPKLNGQFVELRSNFLEEACPELSQAQITQYFNKPQALILGWLDISEKFPRYQNPDSPTATLSYDHLTYTTANHGPLGGRIREVPLYIHRNLQAV